MTKKTEFPLYLLEAFSFDIFGAQQKIGEETKQIPGLLNKKELYQPIKVHLKRLGTKLLEEDKSFKDQIKELRKEYYNEPEKEGDTPILKEGVTELEVNEKAQEMYNTKISIEHYDFKLEDFNYQWEENFAIIDFITA